MFVLNTVQNEATMVSFNCANLTRVLEAEDVPGLLYRVSVHLDGSYHHQSSAKLVRLNDGVLMTTADHQTIWEWADLPLLRKDYELSPDDFEDLIINVFEPVIQADIRGRVKE